MLKQKNSKTQIMQCWLKMVIAAVLFINLLIFARLLMPDAAYHSQQAEENQDIKNMQDSFHIIHPELSFIQLILELYNNKLSL